MLDAVRVAELKPLSMARSRWFAVGSSTMMAVMTGPFLDDPHHALRDAPRVVVEHWPRRLAYTGDVVPIGLVHDVRNGRDVGSCRSSDAKFLYHQSLRDHLDERARRSGDALVVERIDGILSSVGWQIPSTTKAIYRRARDTRRGARRATEPTHGDGTAGQDPRGRREDAARC
jgi:hypothetical protein